MTEQYPIQICGIDDDIYPNTLRKINNSPKQLYYKGNIKVLNQYRNVAVIGSRDCSEIGKKIAYDAGAQLATQNINVINGLALGCDSEAIKGALDARGICAVFMPQGLDDIVPRTNRELAERILAYGGCLLSEYPVGMRARKYQYVERDRLQSGASEAVLVVEAEMGSGTMHTVEYAMKQYRRLACYYHKLLQFSSGNQYLEQLTGVETIRDEQGLADFIDSLTKTTDYQQMTLF